MSKPQRESIVFPNIAAAIGGAVSVDYSTRFAWIKLPGEPELVRISRAKLPPRPADWTSFALADLAKGAK